MINNGKKVINNDTVITGTWKVIARSLLEVFKRDMKNLQLFKA